MDVRTHVTTRHRPERQRVEATTEDGRFAGFSQYTMRGGTYSFFHTEVDDAFEGQGIGSRIAAGVMEFVRENGARIEPRCPFIRAYMRKHPETHDLLAPGASLKEDEDGR